jgi:hypothetical protein
MSEEFDQLVSATKELLDKPNVSSGADEAVCPSSNEKWVYIGPPEPWYKRFAFKTLLGAVKALLTPEGWWRLCEALNALNEVNIAVSQRDADPYKTVTVYHKVTRSRIVLRGDANVDITSYRHLKLDGVVILENCSDACDADPTLLFGK